MRLLRRETCKIEMLDLCCRYYLNNSREMQQIDGFNDSDDVFRWYTVQSFVYRLVNKALRCQDIDLLFKFRFFIADLSSRLSFEHENMLKPDMTTLNVCQEAVLGKKELARFSRNVSQFIATNAFW